jgi:hypothetical protein
MLGLDPSMTNGGVLPTEPEFVEQPREHTPQRGAVFLDSGIAVLRFLHSLTWAAGLSRGVGGGIGWALQASAD